MNILMTGTCRILEMSPPSTALVVHRLIRLHRHINQSLILFAIRRLCVISYVRSSVVIHPVQLCTMNDA